MNLSEMKAMSAALLMLTGCSAASLAPAVQSSALDYGTVFEEYNNQGILRNILRARDNAPLNFSDLPILHGSLSFQAGISASLPFGDTHKATVRDGVSPSLQFTTSPTFDTNPLNTQGFSLNILQPISPSFIANAWGSGVPKRALVQIFLDSVEYFDGNVRKRIYNNPTDSQQMLLVNLISAAIAADLDLRIFDVLQPIGPTIATGNTVAKDLVSMLTSTDESSYHLANANASGTSLQVFRITPGQVFGCLNVKVV